MDKNGIMKKIGKIKKYFYYKADKVELPFYPDRVYMELTNNCNFQCIMCPNGKGMMKREKGFMDFELSKKIIDEMAPHIETIVLHIWGESLLHPRIFDIIKYCKRYNVSTELSTNTSLLNEEIINNILDSGLDRIYLCIDGITKETYQNVRKNGDYESAVKNVEDFIRIKNEKRQNEKIQSANEKQKNKKGIDKPSVYLQIIVMKETINEIEAFKNRWSIDGVNKINIKPLDTWGGQIPEINNLDIRDKDNKRIKRYHCPNLWYHAHIYNDGTLVCCDRDFDAKYPLGNVKDGVMKVWNGSKMLELRKKHIEQNLNDVASCGNCNEWCWWRPTMFSSWGNMPKE